LKKVRGNRDLRRKNKTPRAKVMVKQQQGGRVAKAGGGEVLEKRDPRRKEVISGKEKGKFLKEVLRRPRNKE